MVSQKRDGIPPLPTSFRRLAAKQTQRLRDAARESLEVSRIEEAWIASRRLTRPPLVSGGGRDAKLWHHTLDKRTWPPETAPRFRAGGTDATAMEP